jgi:hypothetical protein
MSIEASWNGMPSMSFASSFTTLFMPVAGLETKKFVVTEGRNTK